MFKFLLILFVLLWLFIRLGGFIVKLLFSGSANQQRQSFNSNQQRSQYRKPSDGNVNIDYIPDAKKERKKNGDIQGGDYVDYEEIN